VGPSASLPLPRSPRGGGYRWGCDVGRGRLGSWEGSEGGASGDGEAEGRDSKAGDSLTDGDSLAGGLAAVGEGLMAGVEDAARGPRACRRVQDILAASAGLTAGCAPAFVLVGGSRVVLTRLPRRRRGCGSVGIAPYSRSAPLDRARRAGGVT
jgi:hypothetical protein